MVCPPRLLVNHILEIEASAVAGELGVGRREQSYQEVHHQHHADDEVERQEDLASPALLIHGVEGEDAQDPGEEGDEGVREGRELGGAEENAA